MPTVLLTLGRLPKGLDIARSFHAAGWRVIVAEPFGWHLCRLSRSVAHTFVVPAPNTDQAGYHKALLALVEREDVALIVPVSEETMHVASLGDALSQEPRLFTAKQADLLALHDKLTFALTLGELDLAAPPTAPNGSREALDLVASGRVVVKDRWGASGSNVAVFERGSTLPVLPNTLVQRCLVGEEVSSFSIVHNGRTTVTVVYRPVVRDGTVSTVFERIDAPAVDAYIDAIARSVGHTGFLSFDLMLTDRGPVAFECNPRANSGIHFLETTDIATAILDPDFTPRFRPARRMQQAYPTLTMLWGSLGNWSRYRSVGMALLSSRDVTWRWRDPMPFVLMTPATWPLLRQALFEGYTLGEAAIRDIGYFGPSNDP